MRLLNARNWELVEFVGCRIPPYAILSHTWGKEELTINDIQSGAWKSSKQSSYEKIKGTLNQAIKDNLEWAWVDTCCIDKSSSAELSEAINSMFRWYARSKICYAYLEDASDLPVITSEDSETHLIDFEPSLARCRWFTRGWTVQELIAPNEVHFFDCGWNFIATRSSIPNILANITGIAKEILDRTKKYPNPLRLTLSECSVAQKMSWAARRKTTRVEDRAYSLLGLFGVNMPLLYGEGHAAFKRLQEEILKISADLSILAWSPKTRNDGAVGNQEDDPENNSEDSWVGGKSASQLLFADVPEQFKQCGNIILNPRGDGYAATTLGEATLTNVSLHVTAPVFLTPDRNGVLNRWLAVLLRCRPADDITRMYALRVYSRMSNDIMNQDTISCVFELHPVSSPVILVDALNASTKSEIKNVVIMSGTIFSRPPQAFMELREKDRHYDYVWVRFCEYLQQRGSPRTISAYPGSRWQWSNATFDLQTHKTNGVPEYASITLEHELTGPVRVDVTVRACIQNDLAFVYSFGREEEEATGKSIATQLQNPKHSIQGKSRTTTFKLSRRQVLLMGRGVLVLEVSVKDEAGLEKPSRDA